MATISSLTYAAQQIAYYFGIPLLIAGIVGGLLNITVFLSLKTFRQSSCAFYLIVISIVNTVQLITGLLSRIMINGFDIDWTHTSLFYCKVRYFIFQTCALISLTCICLALLDQYFATCSCIRWQQWSQLKISHRLTGIVVCIWLSLGIFYLIYFYQYTSSSTGKVICGIWDRTFSEYNTYGFIFILGGVLPVFISVILGFFVHRNIQQLTYRTVPMVRRELDKQLTNMVLNQMISGFFTVLPYAILTIVLVNLNTTDYYLAIILQSVQTLTIYVYYLNYASPFYIYICVSSRFRRQLKYVLLDVHLHRCTQANTNVNQIAPQI